MKKDVDYVEIFVFSFLRKRGFVIFVSLLYSGLQCQSSNVIS